MKFKNITSEYELKKEDNYDDFGEEVRQNYEMFAFDYEFKFNLKVTVFREKENQSFFLKHDEEYDNIGEPVREYCEGHDCSVFVEFRLFD